mmetsp:Transcript_2697/g.10977  ORF Transcript_2697/g.10977 Transcript_2697/m.10977 type:complete len:106 (+) Transcript_2697:637-954(+)
MPSAFSHGTNGSSAARLTASAYRAESIARTSGGHDDDDDDDDDDDAVRTSSSRFDPWTGACLRAAPPLAPSCVISRRCRVRDEPARAGEGTRVDVILILLREQTK